MMIARRAAALLALVAFACAPSAKAAELRQIFPFPKEAVYRALVETLPALGYTIKAEDPVISRVTASAGMSAFSFGENLSMAVVPNGPAEATLEFAGNNKMATNVIASGRPLKHFNRIVLEVSRRLQLEVPPEPANAEPAAAPAP